ncbi:MAG: polysaccharide deacetylase family protein [bacterium]
MTRAEFIKKTVLGLAAIAALPRWAQAEVEITGGEEIVNPHFVSKGCGFGNRIAITFDDGPTPGVTDVILKELDKHNLRATFFMIGKKVEVSPALAKEVVDAGHEAANHSYTHSVLSRFSASQVEYELEKTQEAIFNATGKAPLWFRPPYGAFNKRAQGHIPLSKGLGIVYWSVDPRDWSRPGASAITSRVVSQTTPGSIVLLHDLHSQTAEAVPNIFSGLQEKTFAFANLTRFLGKPYV